MCDNEFELSNESYFVSDIPNYFEYIVKKHKTPTENSPIQIYTSDLRIELNLKLQLGTFLNF